MPLIQITAPASYPVTAADVKAAGRIDGTEFDTQLALLIPALTKRAESLTGRAFVTRDFELQLDRFPCAGIDLQLPDVSAIASIKYFDVDGVDRTLATGAWLLASAGLPSKVYPPYGVNWPSARLVPNGVRVRFTAGFGDAAAVPQEIKLWIIAHCIQAIENPSGAAEQNFSELPFASGLIDDYRLIRVA